MLKSRTMWPPGGWRFREAATEWVAPDGLTFEQLVDKIIEHRRSNKQHRLPTDFDVVSQQLDDYTCARLKNDPSWCTNSAPPNFLGPLPKRSSRAEGEGVVAGGVRHLQNAGAGINLWVDWFGDGQPVDKTDAERRAAICTACKENQRANVFQWFTGIAAKNIKAIFSLLNDLELHTSQDDDLRVCRACDCPLKAKVWAPLPIIKKHMRKEVADKLPENCWILNES